jgi:N utilization substance protein A
MQVLPISSGTPLVLSRLGKRFVARLLEEAVPEIASGEIEIKRIARLPGILTKVAVDLSEQARETVLDARSRGMKGVDPVTACLGRGGSRAQQVQGELGELLNIVRYFEDPRLFVAASLLPAQVRPEAAPPSFSLVFRAIAQYNAKLCADPP